MHNTGWLIRKYNFAQSTKDCCFLGALALSSYSVSVFVPYMITRVYILILVLNIKKTTKFYEIDVDTHKLSSEFLTF
jgi:hypothetical protein